MIDGPDATGPPPPRRLRGLREVSVAGRLVPAAESIAVRLLGLALLDREAAGPGLLLPRCRSVHTFGMRFPLDILFLDRSRRVIASRRAVPAGRVVVEREADAVLEVPSRGSRSRLHRCRLSGSLLGSWREQPTAHAVG